MYQTSRLPSFLYYLELEAVKHHAAAVGTRINVSKTEVISALISGEEHQAIPLDGGAWRKITNRRTFS